MLMTARVNWILQTILKPVICPSVSPSRACNGVEQHGCCRGSFPAQQHPRRGARAVSYFRHRRSKFAMSYDGISNTYNTSAIHV